jgi:hypothetical protein
MTGNSEFRVFGGTWSYNGLLFLVTHGVPFALSRRFADYMSKWQRTIVILECRLLTVTDYASTR